ncbi:myoD family inhibitor domain-containing protein 2-like [Scleropages formosus]|uniref:myoD family inhibitor domain-containing protein 2-like n=1 Tax=Scleropages formosus TaxID=113540 RepID=UPI0010FA79E5|nr:myoD family inhibitor domain-containing protein 2-like [Scleropages formosus]
MSGRALRGIHKLSTISEQEGDSGGGSVDSTEDEGFARSSSSSSLSSDSFQPSIGEDCAAIILTCLFCQPSEFFRIVPLACKRAVDRCFPSCKYVFAAAEPVHDDCCSCKLDLDCNILGSCHEATEVLELALEISEVCHH